MPVWVFRNAVYLFLPDKLLKGVGTSRIISDTRRDLEAGGDPGAHRAYWLKRKDVINIASSIGVTASGAPTKNQNLVVSVEMFAEDINRSQHVSRRLKLPAYV